MPIDGGEDQSSSTLGSSGGVRLLDDSTSGPGRASQDELSAVPALAGGVRARLGTILRSIAGRPAGGPAADATSHPQHLGHLPPVAMQETRMV